MQIQTLFLLLCGILSVKSTPFTPDSSVDFFKLNNALEKLENDSNSKPLPTLNSTDTLDATPIAPVVPVVEGNIAIEKIPIKSTIIIEKISVKPEHGHGIDHTLKNMGPVELGLRNLVSASGIAAEEIFMKMAALRGQTLQMIKTKSEILTSHAMNEIFKPMSVVEVEIKKHKECGNPFISSFNSILQEIDNNLKTCVKNLTIIEHNYKNQTTNILQEISIVTQEISTLPQSCEIVQNFAFGTFCVVNNLAESNTRVVKSVKDMNSINNIANDLISKGTSSTVACQKQLVETVLKNLKNLLKEVDEKCNAQNKPQNNLI